MADPQTERRTELAGRLTEVRARITAACQACGRDPAEITLIAVTKTRPAADVRLLSELGVGDVGENTDQEAAPKARACAGLDPPLTWHFVGQLQTRKCASVVSYAAVVHSVDRLRLVTELARRARQAGRVIQCLIQASLDGQPGRGGAPPADMGRLAEAVAAEDGLVLAGVMAVAPPGGPPGRAFGQLPELAAQVRAVSSTAVMISAGMSGDLEEGIAAGATHVRVGTALLGGRPGFVR